MDAWSNRISLAIAAAIALCGTAVAAPLEVVAPEHQVQLALADGWEPEAQGDDAGAMVRRWRNPVTGQRAMIARIEGPTVDAWRGREAFFDNVERGFVRSADRLAGLERVHRDLGRLGRVPYMDLLLAHDDGAIAARFLFFRRYTIALIIDTPGRWRPHRRAVRQLLGTFKPYFSSDE